MAYSILTGTDPNTDAKIELVRKIRAKTAEGKVKWGKKDNVRATRIGDLSAHFMTDVSTNGWKTFSISVKDESLVNVSNNPFAFILMGTSSGDPLIDEVGKLFSTINDDKDALDRAIKLLDNI